MNLFQQMQKELDEKNRTGEATAAKTVTTAKTTSAAASAVPAASSGRLNLFQQMQRIYDETGRLPGDDMATVQFPTASALPVYQPSLATERADELDKLNLPSASRQLAALPVASTRRGGSTHGKGSRRREGLLRRGESAHVRPGRRSRFHGGADRAARGGARHDRQGRG